MQYTYVQNVYIMYKICIQHCTLYIVHARSMNGMTFHDSLQTG